MKFRHVISFCSSCRETIKMTIVHHGPKSISRFNKSTIETLNSTALWIIDRKSDYRRQS